MSVLVWCAGCNQCVYMCVCVCVSAVNRAMARASLESLVHTGRRAVWVCAHTFSSFESPGRFWNISGTVRVGLPQTPSGIDPASNAVGSRGFGLPETPPLLVHDLGGPARIRHASADYRDILGETDMKGGKGGWSWRPKTSRRRVEKRRIEMGEVEGVDRFNGDGVPRVSPKARTSNVKRRSFEQLIERGHPQAKRRWHATT